MILRDVNAESALITSLGLVALVLVTYYLRMVGREVDFHRLRVAVGGISFGMGIALMLLSQFIVPPSLFYIMMLVGVVSVLAGLLNIVAARR